MSKYLNHSHFHLPIALCLLRNGFVEICVCAKVRSDRAQNEKNIKINNGIHQPIQTELGVGVRSCNDYKEILWQCLAFNVPSDETVYCQFDATNTPNRYEENGMFCKNLNLKPNSITIT